LLAAVNFSQMDYEQILTEKQDYYGKTEASYHFAAEKYATLRMIEENESILEMAKRHLDSRAILVIQSRIDELSMLVA
jgi:hypothetical protein